MAYNLTDKTFTITSDTTDGNGVRWVTLQTTETYTNNQAPFDSYQTVPATVAITTTPSHGSSGIVSMRETTDPYRSSGSAWPNPFTIRSTSLGTSNFQSTGIISGPNNYNFTITSTGPYTVDAAPDDWLAENFASFPDMQYTVVLTDAEVVAPNLYPPDIASGSEVIPPTVNVAQSTSLYVPLLDATSDAVPPVLVLQYSVPVIGGFSPSPGSSILTNTALSFDVTDVNDDLNRIVLVVEFPAAGIKEVLFDGDGFGPQYTNGTNTQTPITNGFTFTVLRDGGWIENDGPIITPFAIDARGLENA